MSKSIKHINQKIKSDKTITVEEIVVTNMYELDAIFNILVKKGILTKEEVLLEVHNLREQNEKIN
ncbi:MAG: hypothetical protein IT280_12440 [Ignavibacteria bacterium]|nr:hypothetical protein [Ignavibacteria bacterium]